MLPDEEERRRRREGRKEGGKGQLELISSRELLPSSAMDSLELSPSIYASLPRLQSIHEDYLLPILNGFFKLYEDGSNLAMVRSRVESGESSRRRGGREGRGSSSGSWRGSRRAAKGS